MYKLISAERKNVGPDLAKHYLTFNTYVGQRPIRAAHVKELSDKMIEGLFRYGNLAFATLEKKQSRWTVSMS